MINPPVIFFDGICNLCNASVQFAIKHDQHQVFKFTALQGDYAHQILPGLGVDLGLLNSIALVEDGKLYTKSTAALRIARRLNGLWPLLYGFIIVPKSIRDKMYDFISRNRYKWWGKQDSCWVPTPALQNRFYP